ncbi:MAG: UDP-N-acetylmuramoyl-L-alanine--D-glutamate ligase [Patescibacteria group bacterium]|jgi:UDP-N-acetylmuramoylalanine--D-glutamate ligase
MENLLNNIRGKKVTVIGLGLQGGGLAAVKWLARKGADILATDLKSRKALSPTISKLKKYKIKYILGYHRHKDFKNADLIIKNPGVPRESEYLRTARKNNIPIETDISIFFRLCPAKITGITGTKGKSTTTSLLCEIIKNSGKKPIIAGNIKVSPLEVLNKINDRTPVILELSSWQLEDMAHLRQSPHIAIITNIMPDHLNRYDSAAEYKNSKKLIFAFQKKLDYCILFYDQLKSLKKHIKSKVLFFSGNHKNFNGSFLQNDSIYFNNNGKKEFIIKQNEVKLLGAHNVLNILAAVTAAKIYGVKTKYIRQTIAQYPGLQDRLEFIAEKNGIKFYNDTTATTPESAVAALDSFKQKPILICGGFDKQLDYKRFAGKIISTAKKVILLKGTATNKIINCFKIKKFSDYSAAGSMQQAMNVALQFATMGDLVLLSPGAASFGMFVNEFDRGDQFKNYIEKLK